MLLDNPNRSLVVQAAAAPTTNPPNFLVEYIHSQREATAPQTSIGAFSNIATEITAAPDASMSHEVLEMIFYNADTVNVVLTIFYKEVAALIAIKKSTLTPGQSLTYQRN